MTTATQDTERLSQYARTFASAVHDEPCSTDGPSLRPTPLLRVAEADFVFRIIEAFSANYLQAVECGNEEFDESIARAVAESLRSWVTTSRQLHAMLAKQLGPGQVAEIESLAALIGRAELEIQAFEEKPCGKPPGATVTFSEAMDVLRSRSRS